MSRSIVRGRGRVYELSFINISFSLELIYRAFPVSAKICLSDGGERADE